MSSRSSTTLWVIIAVIGMGILQWATRSREIRLPPGPERGDIALAQDVLDSEIDGWKQVNFTPAKEPEQLPDGQFWWTFSWTYQKDDLVALVSFDQADWDGWHELTVCYRAIGWELTDRSVSSTDTEQTRPVIARATLQKELVKEHAALVFSEFDQDANLLTAPSLSITQQDEPPPATFMGNLQNRVGYQPADPSQSDPVQNPSKILQAQVFLPHQRHLTDAEQQSLVTLHATCLQRFQNEWLRQKQNSASKAAAPNTSL